MLPSQVAALRSLVKPRIVGLLCVTGASAHLAAGGFDARQLVMFVAAGGMIAGGAAALNCVYDRDIDRLMDRTADRPLPAGDLAPRHAVAVAVALLIAGTVVGVLTLPLLSVVFMHLGTVAYLGLYTVLLKRRHPAGVVLGGIAGSFPVLAGWTAVKPLGLGALLMAALVFVWTPAHAWTLAVVYRDEFIAASIPTLPAVAGAGRVRRAVTVSAFLTIVLALGQVVLAGPVSAVAVGSAGPLYFLSVLWYRRSGTSSSAVRAFFSSNLYIAIVFVAWAVDGAVASLPPATVPLVAGVIIAAFWSLWRYRPTLGGVRSGPVPGRWSVGGTGHSVTVDEFRS